MPVVRKPRERLRDAGNISAYTIELFRTSRNLRWGYTFYCVNE